jgi:nucleotide-binding universal stress UspA family protein
MFQRILVAWDGSELAERALDMAVDLACTYEAEIVAASVLAPAGDPHLLHTAFARAREQCASRGIEPEHAMIEGSHPAHDLLEFAHEHGFDLLVIGHHRHARPGGGIMLHGMTEHLLSAAQLPMLVVGSEQPA